MKKSFTGIVCLSMMLAATVFTGCEKDEEPPADMMYTISGTGAGSQVVPAVTTTATGNITGTYNGTTREMNYNTTWNGLGGPATSAGFYTGASGVAGTSAYPTNITTAGATGASAGNYTLTEAQANDLMNGNWYYSVGTEAYTGGEVRGQIAVNPN